MLSKASSYFWSGVIVAGLLLTGCATRTKTTEGADVQRELEQKEQAIAALEKSVKDMEKRLESRDEELEQTERELREAERRARDLADSQRREGKEPADVANALPSANVGQCFAKVWVPPVYDTKSEKILKREASERIEVIPAKYEWVEERVMVKPATTKIVESPAVFDEVTEKVLDTPAHTVWKKGRGPIEKVDNATGEIWCLVEVPATYKTVTKRVVKTPATTKTVEVPAEYKTVKVRKLTSEEQVKRIPVEAEYITVTRREMVSDGKMEWRSVLCQTNMSKNLISELQRALQKSGHEPGPIDGIYGPKTRAAVASYQKAKGLPSGGLTMRTLKSLGVKVGS